MTHLSCTLIIYVKHPELLQVILFVDDTNIFSAGETLQELLWIFIQEMLQLKTWFDRNKLSLNLNKTTFMLFGNCKKDGGETLLINNVEVEQVFHAYFWVWYDVQHVRMSKKLPNDQLYKSQIHNLNKDTDISVSLINIFTYPNDAFRFLPVFKINSPVLRNRMLDDCRAVSFS